MARIRLILLVLACAVLPAGASAEAEAPPGQLVVSNTALALPAGSQVKARWVSPPLDPKTVENAHWHSLCFGVDSEGTPWLGYQDVGIISPVRQYRFSLSQRFTGFACLDNGAFLIATGADVGFAVPPEKLETNFDNVPLASFQPVAEMPLPGCRVFAGAGGCVYLAGKGEGGGNDVYLLRPGKSGLSGYRKVFSSPEEISWVAGNGETTYAAIGGVIVKARSEGGAPSRVYANARDYIRQLAFSTEAGLFYATAQAVGRVGETGAAQMIMTTPDPHICLRNGTLYVLLPKTMGILALENVQDLRKFSAPVKGVPPAGLKDIRIMDIRFFEAGKDTPDYADRAYSAVFEREPTRFVYFQIEMENLLHSQRRQAQTVSMELHRDGVEYVVDRGSINFDIGPEMRSVWGWHRFGAEQPGLIYPGVYTVKTYLNGQHIADSKFTVSGEPGLTEAIAHDDRRMVQRLINAGADVNAPSNDGTTPLMMAALAKDSVSVKLLLEAGASVKASRADGETALTRALERWTEDTSIALLLLEAGADVNARGKDGKTALYKACERRLPQLVSLLLEHGANPNISSNSGETPLLASGLWLQVDPARSIKVLESLVKGGADTDAKNEDGQTVLFKAVDARSPEAAALLAGSGADVNASAKVYGVERSLLGLVLEEYRMFNNYRSDREKLRAIAQTLQENGAELSTAEYADAYWRDVDKVLDARRLSRLLEMSQAAARDYQPENPQLRIAVIRGLLNAACREISAAKDEYGLYTALNLCDIAADRARRWGLTASCPEISYNLGLIWLKVGSNDNARKCLEEYVTLSPAGPLAQKARELLRQIG